MRLWIKNPGTSVFIHLNMVQYIYIYIYYIYIYIYITYIYIYIYCIYIYICIYIPYMIYISLDPASCLMSNMPVQQVPPQNWGWFNAVSNVFDVATLPAMAMGYLETLLGAWARFWSFTPFQMVHTRWCPPTSYPLVMTNIAIENGHL